MFFILKIYWKDIILQITEYITQTNSSQCQYNVNKYSRCSSQKLDQHNSTNHNLTKITLKSHLPLFGTFSRAKIQSFQQESIFDWEFCVKAKDFPMQISQQVQIGHAISQISLMWPHYNCSVFLRVCFHSVSSSSAALPFQFFPSLLFICVCPLEKPCLRGRI